MTQGYNELTTEEANVILNKGTEPPFSSPYETLYETGVFLCRQCNAPLFLSDTKFDAGCGWPAFDDAIPGRVDWKLDADGRRTEITCKNCHGHLGHVFVGEKMTERNTRFCVNGLSLRFSKERGDIPQYKKAYFGGGCFWCMDAVFSRLIGVLEVRSGYMGGKLPYPNYERICSGVSGYFEVVEIAYLPEVVPYSILLDVFFASHDPTSQDKQGNDAGEQYRSVIFCSDEEQEIVVNSLNKYENDRIFERTIVTEVKPLTQFWIAEDYHQSYYDNNPMKPYCEYVINPKLALVREKFYPFLKKQ